MHEQRRLRAVLVLLVVLAAIGCVAQDASAAPTTVPNGNLENVTGGQPDCFERSGWGDGTVTWSLTTDAHSGSVAQSVRIAGYVNGDRKLLMTEGDACSPAVTPGKTYDLSVAYKSTGSSNALTVFRHSAAGWTYWTDVKALPAAAGWTQVTGTTPVVPAGTDQITFGVSLSSNGTLITDDYAMQATPTVPPTPPSTELTFDGNLEQGAATPTGWFLAGWGDATVNAGVTADANPAFGGSRAYQITMSGRTSGDYKLLPTEARSPAVQPGQIYRLALWYRSTSASNAITVFTHSAAGWRYWTDLQTLPVSTVWSNATVDTPAIPAGVDAIAWGVSLAGNGTLVTDDYSTTLASAAPPPPSTGPEAVGRWTVLQTPMPIRSIHTTLLKNGKVLLIAGSGNDLDNFKAQSFKAAVWDPATGNYHVIPVPKDMFCAGHVTLPDGRVLIQGGTKSYPTVAGGADYGGLKDSTSSTPTRRRSRRTNQANEGHWYPTLTKLGNGNIWMAGGLKEDTTGAVNTELFNTATGRWAPTWQIPQSWSFWGLYPHMFLMADGRMFYSGGHVFGNGLPGTGASIYNPATGAIGDVPGLRQKDMRDQSGSVLLPPAQDQRVLIAGGGNINTNTPAIGLTDVIDLKAANPAYQPAPDLPGDGKMYLNCTLLPDRTVLATNGGKLNRDNTSNVISAATYDPAANSWKSVAADPVPRNYHSSALLLPDGRVATFGSNPGDGSFELRISVYEPSYLFKGPRPTLSGVPDQAHYGDQLSFPVDSASTIRWAQLIRPMSVTHQMDTNARLVDLPIVVDGGVATVTIPSNPNLLPPGPYMLNITDSKGVPSQSVWVSIR